MIIGYMVFHFLQEKYPKYIHNISCCFFFKKSCKNDFFFSVKDKLSKNATYYFTYTTHKSKITSFVYFFFIIFCYSFLGNVIFQLVASFTGFVVGWKLLLLLSFLNMFKLVCCLDWFYEKCTTKYGEHSRRLKDDKTNTKGIEIFSSPNFFFHPRGWKKFSLNSQPGTSYLAGPKKIMFWSLGCQILSFEIVWFFLFDFLGRHIDMSYYYSSVFFCFWKTS